MRRTVVLPAFALLLVLAGCSSGTTTSTTASTASAPSTTGTTGTTGTTNRPASTTSTTRASTTTTEAAGTSTTAPPTSTAPGDVALGPISLDGFGGLHLGMTVDEFRSLTGVEPQTSGGNTQGLGCTTTSAELERPHVRVRFNGEPLTIDFLFTDDPALATASGVHVGDPEAALTQAEPKVESYLGQRFVLMNEARDVAILFGDADGKVSSISLMPADIIATDC